MEREKALQNKYSELQQHIKQIQTHLEQLQTPEAPVEQTQEVESAEVDEEPEAAVEEVAEG